MAGEQLGVHQFMSSARFVDGTRFLRLVFPRPAPNVKVESHFTLFPAITDQTFDGQPHQFGIDWLLEYISAEVEYCLSRFAVVFP